MSETNVYDLDFVSKHCEYEHIYTLQFKSVQPVFFKAGQWAHVGFSADDKDKTKEHHLSFASAPGDEYIEFSMDMASGSEYKNLMAALVPGNRVKAFKINGEFVVNPSTQSEIVFLSGGIGIAPVRSIIRDMQQRQLHINWCLLHVARTGFLYEEELSLLPNAQWRVNHQSIDDVWDNIIEKPDDTRYYVSGSDRFIEGMKEKLMYSDIGSEQIITESFL